MCYNKDVSIASFMAGTSLSMLLYNRGDKYDKHIAVFFIMVTLMQLAEYFMWIDQDCGIINHYASVAAAIILYLQAMIVVVAGYYFNTFSGFLTINYIKYIIYAIFTVWIIYALQFFVFESKNICSKETKKGNLEWKFPGGTIDEHSIIIKIAYFGFMLLPWLFLKNKTKGRLILLLLLLLPLLYFRFNFQEWESLWCLFSVSMPDIWLVIHKNI